MESASISSNHTCVICSRTAAQGWSSGLTNALHVSLDYLLEWEGRKSYSVEDLSDAQKELIDLLYCEFTKPTREKGTLSRQQIEILQKLILIFQNGSC